MSTFSCGPLVFLFLVAPNHLVAGQVHLVGLAVARPAIGNVANSLARLLENAVAFRVAGFPSAFHLAASSLNARCVPSPQFSRAASISSARMVGTFAFGSSLQSS